MSKKIMLYKGFMGIVEKDLVRIHKEFYKELIDHVYDYKFRCEKAIEYIKNNDLSFYPNEEDLLNILQNGSEEK